MGSTVLLFHSIAPGELPPPPPRACLGRDELIEEVVSLAENLTPIALIGAGGIGKTSIALAVLHHGRIKERFGDERRFIRCDQFPASPIHFLSRLSKVIGAGVENPEDITPLRPFLSSREMIIFLDNVESILDPQGMGAREIFAIVDELSRFETVCLCITSRISTVPRHCKRPVIPMLSMESACDIFYGICDNDSRSDVVNNLLKRLDFHALSITLLATIASHNMWDYDRLAREWDVHRVQVLRTDFNESLEATIELSLASPTFRKLGPDARDILGVIAFLPQGINENNFDWLFPTISNGRNVLDKFCALSLTYRSNGFVTMLAPLRDYLSPKDPASSPLLHTTKDHYFSRLSVYIDPGELGFEEGRWITSEDVNVEHLLDIFTSIDTHPDSAWDACAHFMSHLYWHKKRLVVLGSKIEGLPDDHCSKPHCLLHLSRLFQSVGNHGECKRLLVDTLELWRERGDDLQVAQTLRFLSDTNEWLGVYKGGILQAKEALEIYERLNHVSGQGLSLRQLARLLYQDRQFNPAEEAAFRAIDLLSGEGDRFQFSVCDCYRTLGQIYRDKGETEKAIKHFETAIGIASPFRWHSPLFWINYSLAELFFGEKRFDDAYAHVERTKSHVVNDPYLLGRAMDLQALFWYQEGRFEEAKSEALGAAEIYERVGATRDLEFRRTFLQDIEERMKVSGESDSSHIVGEALETMLLPTPVNSPFLVRGAE